MLELTNEMCSMNELALDLSDKDVDNFRKTVHKMSSNSTVQSYVIDRITW